MTDQLVPPAPAPRGWLRAFRPFRHASYRRLGSALVLTSFGGGVWVVALVWEVIRIGGGASALSLVTTAGAVGVLIPALLGGVVADRVPQKLILLATTSVELAGMVLVAVLSYADLTRLWHLAVVAAVAGMAMAFYYPAYSAWLPALVPEEDLLAVNGFEGMVRPTIGQALGPAVAGGVVGAASSSAAITVAAVAYLGGLLVLTRVPLTAIRRERPAATGDDAEPPPAALATALADIREGFAYMVRTPWLLASLLFASVMILVIMGPLEVLVPFLIKDDLGGGPGDHALVMAGFGIGGAVGSLVTASRPMPRRYLTWMMLMWGAGCLPFLVVGFATAVWQVVAAATVVGALFAAPMVLWGTLLQRRVPPELLGRVASLDFFVSISLMPVSMALAGPVAELIGLEATFTIAAVVPVVVAVVAVVAARLPADELAHPLRDEG
ncbi:MFS transporter [Pimelobacter simplex]|uniref:Tetracycline-resistance determinant tetV n=1 Tax=Nocardioides simplex TaxID=2045 RepID=A0A0A1DUD6_NOCSI|nr:MFS transporter [Pimelobacter simplex]AIY20203.2 Tetracycline-resistance determinant tetV [Pimelobacter simplex]GEB16076.1 putative transporter [Pimelobacter simplex]SFM17471.1 Predicted arabinose efflux permease, MFS family [Pimelobacter simplex]